MWKVACCSTLALPTCLSLCHADNVKQDSYIKALRPIQLEDSVDGRRIKVIHFIRHAEGMHNVIRRYKDTSIRASLKYEDAHLSDYGEKQCAAFSSSVGCNLSPDLVVISPMRRTLQTATLCFPHLINKVPWVSLEHIRELVSLSPYNRRISIKEHEAEFDYVDFSGDAHNNSDPIYASLLRDNQTYETEANVQKRAKDFLDWLSKREEREIIVVCHKRYLEILFDTVLDKRDSAVVIGSSGGSAKSSDDKVGEGTQFDNCEMRSVVLLLPSNT